MAVYDEHQEQVYFLAEFEKNWPDLRIFAIPNGGKRDAYQGYALKCEGVKKGVPDLFIPAKLIWIEMKRTKGGKISPEQADWHAYLRGLGHTVLVEKGAEAVLSQLLKLLPEPFDPLAGIIGSLYTPEPLSS